MQLSIRYDDDIHRKLKVIAAYKEKSLNALLSDIFKDAILSWEQKHGVIKFPEE